MHCIKCGLESEAAKFRRQEIHQVGRTYYVCPQCGKANRVEVQRETKPTGWAKKAMLEKEQIRNKFLLALADCKFRILVWGPSEHNPDKREVFEKRKEIRDILRERKQDAYFSEELGPILDELGNPLPVNVAERLHCEHFHLVINIADSTGSLMEAENYTDVLQRRCLLWLRKDQRGFQGGLAAQLASIGSPPIYFEERDLRSCVLTLACEDWVHAKRAQDVNYDILSVEIARNRIRREGPGIQ